MKSMFVVAGRAPAWVTDQTRYAAQRLTEDGRVLVAFTDDFGKILDLPGDVGGANLLGIAPSGYPLWTARLAAALGFRARQDSTVIMMFDGARLGVATAAAVVARLRRERVIVHDLRDDRAAGGTVRRFLGRRLRQIANAVVEGDRGPERDAKSIVLAICDDDTEMAELVVRAVSSFTAEAAKNWRFVLQTSDSAVEQMVADSPRADLINVEKNPVAPDLLNVCDVVIVGTGRNDHYAKAAVSNGVGAVIVGQPIAERLVRRFDGAWLARRDASSLLVALESARHGADGHGRSASNLRSHGDQVVAAVRELASVRR